MTQVVTCNYIGPYKNFSKQQYTEFQGIEPPVFSNHIKRSKKLFRKVNSNKHKTSTIITILIKKAKCKYSQAAQFLEWCLLFFSYFKHSSYFIQWFWYFILESYVRSIFCVFILRDSSQIDFKDALAMLPWEKNSSNSTLIQFVTFIIQKSFIKFPQNI